MFENTNQDESLNLSKPEWIRIPEAVRIFGISRTKLYALMKRHKFTSVSLLEQGQDRATRLINYESLDQYIRSFIGKGPYFHKEPAQQENKG